MHLATEFLSLMQSHSEIALATCVDQQPHVRIVNFIFDESSKTILFTTFDNNQKVRDFDLNDKIAFTTIPHVDVKHLKGIGTVRISTQAIADVAEQFNEKIPGYAETIAFAGDHLRLYEIVFEVVTVTLGLGSIHIFTLSDETDVSRA
jgi:uncharacterized pyridoxamine 5'-phosphate oxidase family protein